jgi:hypothetical protein
MPKYPKWRPKPEILITPEAIDVFDEFQRLSHGFHGCLTRLGHCQHCAMSADTGNGNGGAETGSTYISAME